MNDRLRPHLRKGRTSAEAEAARLMSPILGLIDGSFWKAPLSALLAAFVSLFSPENGALVLLLFVCVVIDLMAGYSAARRRKEARVSFGLRQTIVKGVEYTVVCGLMTGVANAYPTWVPWLDDVTFFFCTITEVKSIVENLGDGRKDSLILKLWALVENEIDKRTGLTLNLREARRRKNRKFEDGGPEIPLPDEAPADPYAEDPYGDDPYRVPPNPADALGLPPVALHGSSGE